MADFIINGKVIHTLLGEGFLVADLGESAVVRFGSKVEVCSKDQLTPVAGVADKLKSGDFSNPLETITHFQSLAISSVNDKWGVFGRSKIDLLPHQMWVCRKAKSSTPCRLLVADDVGLGKTIEAGIILSSFLGTGKIRRLLVMTPAALVKQWQSRMRDMFDVRLTEYISGADTENSRFWENTDMVVASYHTLRIDSNGRMERFLDVEPWDLVIVDEAHHLNKEKKQGATLGHELVQKMHERELIGDMIFFTGTPHRGKEYGFYSLMHLLDSEFDPDKDKAEQLKTLNKYMIRNNKYNVTDLHGKKLFQEPDVLSSTYTYSEEESIFYEMMTNFIANGLAYASTLNKQVGNSVTLVLISMQKLASSSVAAIRNALSNRLKKLQLQAQQENKKLLEQVADNEEDIENADMLAQAEEQLAESAVALKLMKNEQQALEELLAQAEQITSETKIETILDVIEKEYPDENILFFTEYKSTQRLLLEALMKHYGKASTTIINGDERLDNIKFPDGTVSKLAVRRSEAADLFNSGERRFLIATEAAGEGIDLQTRCHILFHVDLPWNPMRLHQRVGRLNRYGQKEKVIVRNFRNPDTVESRIWDKLNTKIAEINRVFGAVMEEKEDLFQLVLGMTPPAMFRDLFAYAPQDGDEEKLTRWYNAQTATFGGEDIFKVVQDMVGNAAKFNYQQISRHLPAVDLPDLVPFFKNIFAYNHKRLTFNGRSFEFQTPEALKSFGIKKEYQKQLFSRDPEKDENVLGVGFKLFDKALEQAKQFDCSVCCNSGVDAPLLIWSVHDQLTDHAGEKQRSFYGIQLDAEHNIVEVLPDWKLLLKLNSLKFSNQSNHTKTTLDISSLQSNAEKAIQQMLKDEDFKPNQAVFVLEGILLP